MCVYERLGTHYLRERLLGGLARSAAAAEEEEGLASSTASGGSLRFSGISHHLSYYIYTDACENKF